jgi:hypothetical protein
LLLRRWAPRHARAVTVTTPMEAPGIHRSRRPPVTASARGRSSPMAASIRMIGVVIFLSIGPASLRAERRRRWVAPPGGLGRSPSGRSMPISTTTPSLPSRRTRSRQAQARKASPRISTIRWDHDQLRRAADGGAGRTIAPSGPGKAGICRRCRAARSAAPARDALARNKGCRAGSPEGLRRRRKPKRFRQLAEASTACQDRNENTGRVGFSKCWFCYVAKTDLSIQVVLLAFSASGGNVIRRKLNEIKGLQFHREMTPRETPRYCVAWR